MTLKKLDQFLHQGLVFETDHELSLAYCRRCNRQTYYYLNDCDKFICITCGKVNGFLYHYQRKIHVLTYFK